VTGRLDLHASQPERFVEVLTTWAVGLGAAAG
jgi:hypothetical protein